MSPIESRRQAEAINLILATFNKLVGGAISIAAPGLPKRVWREMTSYLSGITQDTSALTAALQDWADWIADELAEIETRRGRR